MVIFAIVIAVLWIVTDLGLLWIIVSDDSNNPAEWPEIIIVLFLGVPILIWIIAQEIGWLPSSTY